MSPVALAAVGGMAVIGAVVVLSARRSVGRSGRPFGRSIPEAVHRASRTKGRVLVAFVRPGETVSTRLVQVLAGAPELEARLRGFELVRLDVGPEDEAVMNVLAAKYGVAHLSLPTLLALDGEARALGALEGPKPFGRDGGGALVRVDDFVGGLGPA